MDCIKRVVVVVVLVVVASCTLSVIFFFFLRSFSLHLFVSQRSLNDEERGGNCLLVPERSYGLGLISTLAGTCTMLPVITAVTRVLAGSASLQPDRKSKLFVCVTSSCSF